jgi:adenylate kinase
MLRALGKLDTPLAQRVRELQANGQLVDTPTVLNVLEDGLVRLLDDRPDTPGFILDGFPRNREQAEGLFELCQRTGAKIGKAVYLSVPNEAIVERAANRRMCSVTGKIYNIQTITDAERQECERLGGVLEHRNDDKPEMVQRRLDSFDADTKPILAMFEQAGVLVEVNGHRAINEITQELEGIVTNALSSRQA